MTTRRLEKLKSFEGHLIHRKLLARLSKAERAQLEAFIRERESLSDDEYVLAVNRWLLDQPKPKRFTDMWALALQSK